MIVQLVGMVRTAIFDPKGSAAWHLKNAPSREVLWTFLTLIVVLSVILSQIGTALAPVQSEYDVLLPFAGVPLFIASMLLGLMALLVSCTHFIGRAFGGTGTFVQALMLITWLQTVMIVLQVVQIVALVVSYNLGAIIGVLGVGLFLWLYVNFVAVLHGFESLALIFLGIVVSMFGLVFGVSILINLLTILVRAG